MNFKLFTVCLVAVLLCDVEGEWCVGWSRSSGGKGNPKPLPCNFKVYDSDGNEEIAKEEFFSSAGVKGYPREGLPVIFAVLDADDDGVVSMEEFKAAVHKLERIHLVSKCKRMFGGWKK